MNKIQEIRHILTMLDAQEWVDNQAIANKINRAVKLLTISNEKRREIDRGLTGLYAIPNYLTSLDAIKGLEREGWYPIVYAISNGAGCIMGYQASMFSMYGKVDAPDSPTKPLFLTEHAARLYAVLLTWTYEEEQNNDE